MKMGFEAVEIGVRSRNESHREAERQAAMRKGEDGRGVVLS
jgi:hypothetical protein